MISTQNLTEVQILFGEVSFDLFTINQRGWNILRISNLTHSIIARSLRKQRMRAKGKEKEEKEKLFEKSAKAVSDTRTKRRHQRATCSISMSFTATTVQN